VRPSLSQIPTVMARTPLRRSDDGLATVEFAIVGSLLLLLVFAILSVGFFISAHTEAADEARFQARAAALLCTPAQVQANVVVTKSVTKPVTWFVPFIPAPASSATETVSYRCGA
jgi:Flp pilus assembly protein TadG